MKKIKLLVMSVITALTFSSCDNNDIENTNNHALLVIDMQNDFCEGGSLQVGPNPNEVIPYINNLIQSDNYAQIVFSQDWHPADHGSFASQHDGYEAFEILEDFYGVAQMLWPDHCVQNSTGAEFHPNIDVSKTNKVIQKGLDKRYDSYSAFKDNNVGEKTELNAYLQEHFIKEVTVVGLALDYCVKYTCIDAIANGYKVNLHLAGTRAVQEETGNSALEEMKKLGVNVVE